MHVPPWGHGTLQQRSGTGPEDEQLRKLFEGPILAKPIEITTDEVRSAREEVRAIVQEAQKALSASYDDQLLKLESIVAALGD